MRPCASFVGLALCVLVSACREEPSKETDVAEVPVADTNQPFTPPEIRRVWDSSRTDAVPDTTPAVASPAPPPLDPNHGARPVPVAPAAVPPTTTAPAAATAPKPAATAPVSAPVAIAPPTGDIVGPGDVGEWTIQVGIHKSEEGARGMIAKLAAKGIPSYVVQAASNAGLSGSYWRVRVGRFAARADAQKFGDKVLVPGGYSFWIDRKSNEAPAAGGTP
jgi:cell division septation protein DedD